ncbi:MAG: phosphoadenosine phosphosulfate reductase family protein [Sphaerobacter sp.]|nr:phosphoadenosine phosphosulfate reductase family protein [Sphaerobacter sp.]
MTENRVRVRHILSLSGGKDSTALAIYLRDRIAELEYVFCDTGEELPETYEYLERVEAYLGKPIVRLNPDRPFSHYLKLYRGVLPDARTRWCTRLLKIRPFERYVGEDPVINYIAIRADEPHRKGYISIKPNITARYPFIEDNITRVDVLRILEESGLGLPEYYRWRSRSGCYFCFFQQRSEWVGLLQNHPDLFEAAKQFEKFDPETNERFTWNPQESLEELSQPSRVAQILAEKCSRKPAARRSTSLIDIVVDDEAEVQSCLICHL